MFNVQLSFVILQTNKRKKAAQTGGLFIVCQP